MSETMRMRMRMRGGGLDRDEAEVLKSISLRILAVEPSRAKKKTFIHDLARVFGEAYVSVSVQTTRNVNRAIALLRKERNKNKPFDFVFISERISPQQGKDVVRRIIEAKVGRPQMVLVAEPGSVLCRQAAELTSVGVGGVIEKPFTKDSVTQFASLAVARNLGL